MCTKEMCCLEITIAARFVGVFGLIISVIVMSQLISELSHHEGRGKIATLLGIDIDEFEVDEDNATIIKHRPFETVILSNTTAENNSTNTKGTVEPNYFLVICFLFAIAQVLVNALLIWGTIVEKRIYVVPWFLCETMSLMVQVAGFVHYVKHEKNDVNTQVLAAAIVNIVVTVYFWWIVFRAQERWNREDSLEGISHAVVETKSTEVANPAEKLSHSPQPPIITVISEPALVI